MPKQAETSTPEAEVIRHVTSWSKRSSVGMPDAGGRIEHHEAVDRFQMLA